MVNKLESDFQKVYKKMEEEGRVTTISAEGTRRIDLNMAKSIEKAQGEIEKELREKGITINISNK